MSFCFRKSLINNYINPLYYVTYTFFKCSSYKYYYLSSASLNTSIILYKITNITHLGRQFGFGGDGIFAGCDTTAVEQLEQHFFVGRRRLVFRRRTFTVRS